MCVSMCIYIEKERQSCLRHFLDFFFYFFFYFTPVSIEAVVNSLGPGILRAFPIPGGYISATH